MPVKEQYGMELQYSNCNIGLLKPRALSFLNSQFGEKKPGEGVKDTDFLNNKLMGKMG